MPNWCEGHLDITASKTEELVDFIKKVMRTDKNGNYTLDFNKIIPEPQKEEDCDKDCLVDENSHIKEDEARPWFDWYKWHWKHWGTKWNCSGELWNLDLLNEVKTEELTTMVIYINTAWSPALPIIRKLQEMFPNLIIEYKYYECGMAFAGEVFSDGQEIDIPVEDLKNPETQKWLEDNGFSYWDGD